MALWNALGRLFAPGVSSPSPISQIASAASAAAPAAQSVFDECVKLVLVSEGGNDDDPRDPGGRTSRGIIQREYNTWRNDHIGLPADVWKAPQQTIIDIYHQSYWNAVRGDDLPAGVNYCVFDYGVNSGNSRAIKLLQACVGVNADGVFGPITLAAVRRIVDPVAFIDQYQNARLAFLHGLGSWGTFGRGWEARVVNVRMDAKRMARAYVVPLPLSPIIEPPKPLPEPSELHDLGSRIKRTMQAKTYPWFIDQNVVSVEGMNPDGTINLNRPNAFDDIKMVLDGDGKIIGGPWEGTTQPGVYWTTHPMASGGAFIIAKGPQACWTPGPYHNRTVWRQADDSPIYGTRDPNCTYKRQGEPIKHGDIGVHHHGGYDLPRDNIANAAAGCQVIRLWKDQDAFMALTQRCPRYLADKANYRLTATVLEAKDVLQ